MHSLLKLRSSMQQSPGNGSSSSSCWIAWRMVGLAFVLECMSIGSLSISGVLVSVLRERLNVPTSTVLLWTTSLLFVTMAVLMPLGGALLRRMSVRLTGTLAMVSLAIGYACLGYVREIWHLVVLFSVFFPIAAAGALLSANTLVSNWFVAKRGLALGIATSGIMVGGAVFPPVAAHLLKGGLTNMAWPLASIAFVLVPLMAMFIVSKPEDIGFLPKGMSRSPAELGSATIRAELPSRRKDLLRHPLFWVVTVLLSFLSASMTAFDGNLVPFAESLGVEKTSASYLVSASSLAAAVGVVMLGEPLNRIGPRALVSLPTLLVAIAAAVMAWLPAYSAIFASSVAIGALNGALGIAPALVAAKFFGRSGFSLAFGFAMFIQLAMTAVAIPLYGAGFDEFGSYQPVLAALAGTLAALGIGAAALPRTFPLSDVVPADE